MINLCDLAGCVAEGFKGAKTIRNARQQDYFQDPVDEAKKSSARIVTEKSAFNRA